MLNLKVELEHVARGVEVSKEGHLMSTLILRQYELNPNAAHEHHGAFHPKLILKINICRLPARARRSRGRARREKMKRARKGEGRGEISRWPIGVGNFPSDPARPLLVRWISLHLWGQSRIVPGGAE